MESSNSGIITNDFIRVSDSFADYTDIRADNHSRLVKAQRFGKWYVLKGLKSEFADKSIFIELLRKEFDLGVSLDHPNIVRTIGIENDPQIGDCIVLEYIDGTTLRGWLTTNPQKSQRKQVAMQLLDAMSYFHAKGITHRDLKPENILITHNGANVKIIDFGLSDSDQYAILKQPAGSRKYSAPEQLLSDTIIDSRADIYSFGRILEELSIYKQVSKRATRHEPDKRYSSAREIVTTINNRHLVKIFTPILLAVVAASIAFATQPKQTPKQQTEALNADTIIQQVLAQLPTPKTQEVAVKTIVVKQSSKSDSLLTANKSLGVPILKKAERLIDSLYLPIVKKYKTVEKIDFKSYSALQDSTDDKHNEIIKLLQADMPEELKNDNDFQLAFSAILSKYDNEMIALMGKIAH